MTPAEIGIVVAAIATGAGGFGYLIRARTDWKTGSAAEAEAKREDVQLALSLKEQVIDTLKEANEDLRAQLASLTRDLDDLKARLGVVEHEYRSLLKRAVELGICANAPSCMNYLPPGDRRGESKVG